MAIAIRIPKPAVAFPAALCGSQPEAPPALPVDTYSTFRFYSGRKPIEKEEVRKFPVLFPGT